MNYGIISFDNLPALPKISLHRPNRTKVRNINSAYNIQLNVKVGNVNELSFDVPRKIDIRHQLKNNKDFDMIRDRYLIRLDFNGSTEWFLIIRPEDSGSETIFKTVSCYSLGFELNDRMIVKYKETSVNLQKVVSDVLQDTLWKRVTVNPDVDMHFDTKYRSFDFSSMSKLECLYQIAETFDSIIVWNTKDRTIQFEKEENLGNYKGLRMSYEKYIKSIGNEKDSTTMATRLKVFGKNGMSIQKFNPTGSNYLEDFGYFLYPFEIKNMDTLSYPIVKENVEIIKHSNYMSDDLCIAILNYNKKISDITPSFRTLITDLSDLQKQKSNKETELFTEQTDLKMLYDELDINNAKNQSNTTTTSSINTKKARVNSLQSAIQSLKSQIQSKQSQIDVLREQVKVENNFSPTLLQEREQFIIEKEWVENNHFDDAELYKDAIKRFDKYKEPQINVSIDVVDFTSVIECQHDWDKLKLGDIAFIDYDPLGIKIKARIIGIQYDFENHSIQLEISNVIDFNSVKDRLSKLLYKSLSTSTTLENNKGKWDAIDTLDDNVNEILNNAWNANKRIIRAGVKESVTISNRGIIIKNPDNPNKYLVAQHGILALTNDGGTSWKHAITPDGIIGDRIIGNIIIGNQLTIQNSRGSFIVNNSGVRITDMDLSVERSDGRSRVRLNANQGMVLEGRAGGSWQKKFYFEDDELVINGKQSVRSGGTILLESYKDTNGGRLAIYDNSGQINAILGSEKGSGGNRGGTLILYDDSWSKKRVEMSVFHYGYGAINIRNQNSVATVFLYGGNQSSNFGNVGVGNGSSESPTALIRGSGASFFRNELIVNKSSSSTVYGLDVGDSINTRTYYANNNQGVTRAIEISGLRIAVVGGIIVGIAGQYTPPKPPPPPPSPSPGRSSSTSNNEDFERSVGIIHEPRRGGEESQP